MNVVEPPLGSRPQASPADGELDGLLWTFFRNELPQPWPALRPPAANRPMPPRKGVLTPSRVALAASVALLFGGQAWLHRALRPDESANLNDNAAAGVPVARPDLHGKKAPRPTAAVPGPVKDAAPAGRPAKPMR